MVEPNEPFDIFLIRQGDEVVWAKDWGNWRVMLGNLVCNIG